MGALITDPSITPQCAEPLFSPPFGFQGASLHHAKSGGKQQFSLWPWHSPPGEGTRPTSPAKPSSCRPGALTRLPHLVHNENCWLRADGCCFPNAGRRIPAISWVAEMTGCPGLTGIVAVSGGVRPGGRREIGAHDRFLRGGRPTLINTSLQRGGCGTRTGSPTASAVYGGG